MHKNSQVSPISIALKKIILSLSIFSDRSLDQVVLSLINTEQVVLALSVPRLTHEFAPALVELFAISPQRMCLGKYADHVAIVRT